MVTRTTALPASVDSSLDQIAHALDVLLNVKSARTILVPADQSVHHAHLIPP